MAYGTQRVLVYNSSSDLPYHRLYEPISKTCVNIAVTNEAQDVKKSKYNIKILIKLKCENSILFSFIITDVADRRIIKLEDVVDVNSISSTIPSDLVDRVVKLFEDPVAWWNGQIRKYFMRPTNELKTMMQKISQKSMVTKPTVGLQIRRSTTAQLKHYMDLVEEYYELLELTTKVDKRKLFVASDDQSVAKQIQTSYPKYEVFSMADAMDVFGYMKYQFSDPTLFEIIMELNILKDCDFIVGTFSSNISRILYEIVHQNSADAFKKMVSVDEYYYSSKITAFESIFRHERPEAGELSSAFGDVFYDSTHLKYGGLVSVYSEKTKSLGKLPIYKLKKRFIKGNFAKYDTVH